jgi:hypothetical protein
LADTCAHVLIGTDLSSSPEIVFIPFPRLLEALLVKEIPFSSSVKRAGSYFFDLTSDGDMDASSGRDSGAASFSLLPVLTTS